MQARAGIQAQQTVFRMSETRSGVVAEQLQRAEAPHSPRLRVCRLLKEQLLYKKKRGRRLRFCFTESVFKVVLQKSIPAHMRQPILCQYGHEE